MFESKPLISVFFPISRVTDKSLLNLSLFSLSGQSYSHFELIFIREEIVTDLNLEGLVASFPFDPFTLSKIKTVTVPSLNTFLLPEVFNQSTASLFLWLEENTVLYPNALEVLLKRWQITKRSLTLCGSKKALFSHDRNNSSQHCVSKRTVFFQNSPIVDIVLSKKIPTSSILISRTSAFNQIKWSSFSKSISFSYNLVLNLLSQLDLDLALSKTPLCESITFSEECFYQDENLSPENNRFNIPLVELQHLISEHRNLSKEVSSRPLKWFRALCTSLNCRPKLKAFLRTLYTSTHRYLFSALKLFP